MRVGIVFDARDDAHTPSLLYCGDDREDRQLKDTSEENAMQKRKLGRSNLEVSASVASVGSSSTSGSLSQEIAEEP